ncbi:MAG: sugar phosphate isomerase/epimerase [Clostridia bacterium]|nr:sugar phosphate isomerase/epimerase [Clostridia bacterium]
MKEIRLCDDTEIDKVLGLCSACNLGVELQGFYNPNFIIDKESKSLIIDYKTKLKGFKQGKSFHAPFWELNLGSKNLMVKNATMKIYNIAYSIAKKLGCTEIVVHNGFVPNTSFYQGWVKNATAFWKEFFADKDDSITMMLENQCEEDSEVLKMEIDSVNDKRLKVCMDIGHANANSKMSVKEWIISLNDRIGYVHLHNNHGEINDRPSFMNDEHLGLGQGIIDIKETLGLLEKYSPDAIWAIECKLEYIEESVKLLKDLGYINNKTDV